MMKSNLVLALAMIGFIASSACSRSGSQAPPQPPGGTAQAPQPTASPIPNSQSELDGDSGRSAQNPRGPQDAQNSGAPQAPHGNHQNDNQSDNRSNDNANSASAADDRPQVVNSRNNSRDSRTAPGTPEVITYDPTGLTPEQIFARSNRQGPAVVGNESDIPNGQSYEPLYFSGAGQDDLRAQLQTWVETKTKPERVQRDKEFAKKLSNGRVDVDWSSRAVTLDLTIKTAQGPRVQRFAGHLDNRLNFVAGDLLKGNHLRVSAACMDLNGGCHTVYAMVQDASGGLVKTAHMLIRQTDATLFTHAYSFGRAHNQEFDSFLETLIRTDHHAGELNSVNSLVLRTSETINGPANFRVEMGILSARNTQDSLNFGGALVKPAADIELQANAQVLRSTSPVANTVRDVVLTNNDGRGTLTLSVTTRKASVEAQEDSMEITVARIHRPVRPLIVK